MLGYHTYAHIKEGKLELRTKKCIFLGYPKGVKEYKIWCQYGKSSKCIISRDVTFNEAEKLNAKKFPNETEENSVKKKVELKVEPSNDDLTDQGEEENERHLVKENTQELQQYNLVKDGQRREIRPLQRYDYVDLASYALSVADDIKNQEPQTYCKAIIDKESAQWIAAISGDSISS